VSSYYHCNGETPAKWTGAGLLCPGKFCFSKSHKLQNAEAKLSSGMTKLQYGKEQGPPQRASTSSFEYYKACRMDPNASNMKRVSPRFSFSWVLAGERRVVAIGRMDLGVCVAAMKLDTRQRTKTTQAPIRCYYPSNLSDHRRCIIFRVLGQGNVRLTLPRYAGRAYFVDWLDL
jgi:hypothetical protein